MLRLFLILPAFLVLSGNLAFGQKYDPLSDILPQDSFGPVGIVNELDRVYSNVSSTIAEVATSDQYVSEEFYFEGVTVDEKSRKLVVWLDPVHLLDGLVSVDELQSYLNTSAPIEIRYGFFKLDASLSEATSCPSSSTYLCFYWNRYVERCLPEHNDDRCERYSSIITNSYGQPLPLLIPPSLLNNAIIFFDDFEDGLTKWTETDEPDWRADEFDEGRLPPDHTSPNNVAEADNCDTMCTLTVADRIDISGHTNPTLEFWRYVDRSIDDYDEDGEYLKIEITTDGNTWRQLDIWTEENGDDDDAWHKETYDLTPYKSGSFKLRFVTSTSSSGEDVGIDDVKVTSVLPRQPEILTSDSLARIDGNFSEYSLVDPLSKKIRGGTGLIHAYTDPRDGEIKPSISTAGLVVRNGTDTLIIGAGHTADIGDTVGIKYANLNFTDLLGTVSAKSYPTTTESVSSDALSIAPNTAINFDLRVDQIIRNDGVVLNVDSKVDPLTFQRVTLIGKDQDKDGYVYSTNSTVSAARQHYLTNIALAGYSSVPGDSGGPVISNNSAGTTIHGIHTGGFCEIRFGDRVLSYWNLTDSDPYACILDHQTVHKGFSTWESIASDLNLQ